MIIHDREFKLIKFNHCNAPEYRAYACNIEGRTLLTARNHLHYDDFLYFRHLNVAPSFFQIRYVQHGPRFYDCGHECVLLEQN
jgi:hypothetical protein